MKKWNHYICEKCNQVTVARHDQEGVTPFMLKCRATKDCEGFAESCMFMGPQRENQTPHVVFYRPPSLTKAIEEINKEPEQNREWLLEHYTKGGSLMREV